MASNNQDAKSALQFLNNFKSKTFRRTRNIESRMCPICNGAFTRLDVHYPKCLKKLDLIFNGKVVIAQSQFVSVSSNKKGLVIAREIQHLYCCNCLKKSVDNIELFHHYLDCVKIPDREIKIYGTCPVCKSYFKREGLRNHYLLHDENRIPISEPNKQVFNVNVRYSKKDYMKYYAETDQEGVYECKFMVKDELYNLIGTKRECGIKTSDIGHHYQRHMGGLPRRECDNCNLFVEKLKKHRADIHEKGNILDNVLDRKSNWFSSHLINERNEENRIVVKKNQTKLCNICNLLITDFKSHRANVHDKEDVLGSVLDRKSVALSEYYGQFVERRVIE